MKFPGLATFPSTFDDLWNYVISVYNVEGLLCLMKRRYFSLFCLAQTS